MNTMNLFYLNPIYCAVSKITTMMKLKCREVGDGFKYKNKCIVVYGSAYFLPTQHIQTSF